MSSKRIVKRNSLHEQLVEHCPAKVIVMQPEGEPVIINVPDSRKRHAHVLTALQGVPWTRADLLDRRGGLLCRHERTADDRDIGDTDDLPIVQTGRVSELGGLIAVILPALLRAQETVLTATQRQFQGLFEAQAKMTETVLKRFDLQERQLQNAMALNHRLSSDLVAVQLGQLQVSAEADGEAQPESDRALSALFPAMLRALMTKEAAPVKEVADKDKVKKKQANGVNNGTKPEPNGTNGAVS